MADRESGEFAPGTEVVRLPDRPAGFVRLKARSGNAGKVYVGFDADLTVPEGTTDVTSGFELAAGEDTGWIHAPNLNVLYAIGDGATDSLLYLVTP